MPSRVKCLLTLALAIALAVAAPAQAAPEKILVFAAASTTNAITDICKLFEEKGLGQATPSFASSSTLAKQIESGAPANVFLSANPKWMDFLEEKKLLAPGTRVDLLGNRIVLIAPAADAKPVTIEKGFDLAGLLNGGNLAMGDPDHVPAGIYGKQAMENLGVWAAVEPSVARAKDVRAALALVEQRECPYGEVYATDAAISKGVKVVGVFPEDSHPAIVYPAAVLADGDTPTARAFLEFLGSDEARAIFDKYGFSVR